MRSHASGLIVAVVLVVAAIEPAAAADTGIDIVRMPRSPSAGKPIGTSQPQQPESAAAKSQGRLLKLTVKVGSQPNDKQRGWLGIRMDPLEASLAASLGLNNASGALVLDTIAGSPLAQSGIRFGDVIVALNGQSIAGVSDLQRRISSIAPSGGAVLDVWRTSAEEADFLQTLRRLGYGGDAHAMQLLGKIYATGSGVVRDDGEALQWYRKGAAAGSVIAMTALGAMILDGRGSSQDAQEGVSWLRKAADQNHLEAMYRLARVLSEGKVVPKDAAEAVRLFTKGAEAGHTPSMTELGLRYARGEGVEVDFAKAAAWYKRAADLGNVAAINNLGGLYQQGKGVAQDAAAAVAHYRRAVALGWPAAMHNLAWMLDSGQGVPSKNPEEAADLMMRSLDRRNEFSHRQMTQSARGWSKEFRQALQRRLRDAGVYSGPTDGEFKDTTIAAIDSYMNRVR